jgi:hypothetical protein
MLDRTNSDARRVFVGLPLERRRVIAAELLAGRHQYRPDITPGARAWLIALGFGHCIAGADRDG